MHAEQVNKAYRNKKGRWFVGTRSMDVRIGKTKIGKLQIGKIYFYNINKLIQLKKKLQHINKPEEFICIKLSNG